MTSKPHSGTKAKEKMVEAVLCHVYSWTRETYNWIILPYVGFADESTPLGEVKESDLDA